MRRLREPQKQPLDQAFAVCCLRELSPPNVGDILREAYPHTDQAGQYEILGYACAAWDGSFIPVFARVLDSPPPVFEHRDPDNPDAPAVKAEDLSRHLLAAQYAHVFPDARFLAGLEKLAKHPELDRDWREFDGHQKAAVETALRLVRDKVSPRRRSPEEERILGEARKRLLRPDRHDVSLKNVPVSEAVRKLRQLFGVACRTPDLDRDEAKVEKIRVTVVMKGASFEEALAAMCSQAGLGIFRGLQLYVPSYRRGDTSYTAMDGFVFDCRFSSTGSWAGEPDLTCFVGAKSAVEWLDWNSLHFRLDHARMRDGTVFTDQRAWQVVHGSFHLPLSKEQFVQHGGRIAEIRGTARVLVPTDVRRREFEVAELGRRHEVTDGPHFLTIKKGMRRLIGRRRFHVEWGVPRFRSMCRRPVDKGLAVALDGDGRPVKDDYCISSGGGLAGDREYDEFTLAGPLPARVVWTYATKVEIKDVPVVFKDIEIPDEAWEGP